MAVNLNNKSYNACCLSFVMILKGDYTLDCKTTCFIKETVYDEFLKATNYSAKRFSLNIVLCEGISKSMKWINVMV